MEIQMSTCIGYVILMAFIYSCRTKAIKYVTLCETRTAAEIKCPKDKAILLVNVSERQICNSWNDKINCREHLLKKLIQKCNGKSNCSFLLDEMELNGCIKSPLQLEAKFICKNNKNEYDINERRNRGCSDSLYYTWYCDKGSFLTISNVNVSYIDDCKPIGCDNNQILTELKQQCDEKVRCSMEYTVQSPCLYISRYANISYICKSVNAKPRHPHVSYSPSVSRQLTTTKMFITDESTTEKAETGNMLETSSNSQPTTWQQTTTANYFTDDIKIEETDLTTITVQGICIAVVTTLLVLGVSISIYCAYRRRKKQPIPVSNTSNYEGDWQNFALNQTSQDPIDFNTDQVPNIPITTDGVHFPIDPKATKFTSDTEGYSTQTAEETESTYMTSRNDVYTKTYNRRNDVNYKETNIYSHCVDTVYDTSEHTRKRNENDDTYDHFFGQKTEDNYDTTKRT